MALDRRTQQPIFHGGSRATVNSVGSYQVSGLPWITGSAALDEDQVQMVEFPYVAKSFTIINKETESANKIRVHFESGSGVTALTIPGHSGEQTIADTADVIAGRHFITVEAGGAVTFDTKCKRVYLSHSISGLTATYEIFAELTTIPTGSMYILTGSGVTDSGRVPPA